MPADEPIFGRGVGNDPERNESNFANPKHGMLNTVAANGLWRIATVDGASTTLQLETSDPSGQRLAGDEALAVEQRSRSQHWLNTDRGVQHIIELHEPSVGERIERITVAGMKPELQSDDVIVLLDDTGLPRLRYSGLYVWDAYHRRQTAWFAVASNAIEIHIDVDDLAAWPITIDPLVASANGVGIAGNVLRGFGMAMAVGDVIAGGGPELIIGATRVFDSDGGFYVFNLDATGAYVLNFGRFADQTYNGDARCGSSLAIGNVAGGAALDLVVGCPLANDFPGGILVYTDGLPTLPSVVLNNPNTRSGLAGVGQLVVANVRSATNNLEIVATDRTGLLVYDLSVNNTPVILPLTATAYPQLSVIRMNNDASADIAVGMRSTVRFYTGSPNGIVFNSTHAVANNGPGLLPNDSANRVAAGDVDGDGDDDLLVGSPDFPNVAGGTGQWALYRNNGAGAFTAGTEIYDLNTNTRFGASVALADVNKDRHLDVITCSQPNTGTASSLCMVMGGRPATTLDGVERVTWGYAQAFQAGIPVPAVGDMQGDGAPDVFFGLPGYAANPQFQPNDGLVIPNVATPAGLRTNSFVRLRGQQAGGRLGAHSMLITQTEQGDVIAGEPDYRVANVVVGAVHMWRGGQNMDAVPDWTLISEPGSSTNFGQSIAVIKMRGANQPASIAINVPQANQVKIYHINGATGVPTNNTLATADLTINAPAGNGSNLFGFKLERAGNMVGVNEGLIVGAPLKDGIGRIYVYKPGSNGNVITLNQTILESEAHPGCAGTGEDFGRSFANVGRVVFGLLESDRLMVMIPKCGSNQRGRAVLFNKAPQVNQNGLLVPGTWTFVGDLDGAEMSVAAGIGDINKDGAPDFALGAPRHNGGRGKVWVFYSAAPLQGLPSTTPALQLVGGTYNGEGAAFGASIAGGSDVNRDGYKDFIVGAPFYANALTTLREGKVYVYGGAPTAAGITSIHTSTGNCADCQVGTVVSAGNVDSNSAAVDYGFGDMSWTAPGAEDTANVDEGVVPVRIGIW